MGKLILIVEDEEKIRNMYRNALTEAGYTVTEATTAGEGYDLVVRKRFDLIILDIRMPDVDGATFNEVVRLFFRNSKVLVASVYPVENQRSMIRDAVDYFDKAEGIDILVEKVHHCMDET